MHHVHLSWVQKCNAVMSVDYEVTLSIKRGGVLFTLVRFEVDCHRYTDVPQVTR